MDKLETLRQIVKDCQASKVDGKLVDLYSASAVLKVYDALNDRNKTMFIGLPISKMISVAFKLLD